MKEKLQEQSKAAGFTPMSESIAHTALNNVLAHHGVKGMRWGVKKASEHPVSEDHAMVEAHSTKAKKGGGVSALSNKELQDVITRKNLEKQYGELNGAGTRFDKGYKHINRVLKGAKTFGDAVNTTEATIKNVKKGIGIAKTVGRQLGAL